MTRTVDKIIGAVALLVGVWGLAQMGSPADGSWARMPGAPGRVRILQFQASVGALIAGQKAQLCYGVENARSVRIAPVPERVYPSPNHCMEIGPRHTTHYTLIAIGFDSSVATRSLTLPVQASQPDSEPLVVIRLALTD